jgi:hypothetical protein
VGPVINSSGHHPREDKAPLPPSLFRAVMFLCSAPFLFLHLQNSIHGTTGKEGEAERTRPVVRARRIPAPPPVTAASSPRPPLHQGAHHGHKQGGRSWARLELEVTRPVVVLLSPPVKRQRASQGQAARDRGEVPHRRRRRPRPGPCGEVPRWAGASLPPAVARGARGESPT